MPPEKIEQEINTLSTNNNTLPTEREKLDPKNKEESIETFNREAEKTDEKAMEQIIKVANNTRKKMNIILGGEIQVYGGERDKTETRERNVSKANTEPLEIIVDRDGEIKPGSVEDISNTNTQSTQKEEIIHINPVDQYLQTLQVRTNLQRHRYLPMNGSIFGGYTQFNNNHIAHLGGQFNQEKGISGGGNIYYTKPNTGTTGENLGIAVNVNYTKPIGEKGNNIKIGGEGTYSTGWEKEYFYKAPKIANKKTGQGEQSPPDDDQGPQGGNRGLDIEQTQSQTTNKQEPNSSIIKLKNPNLSINGYIESSLPIKNGWKSNIGITGGYNNTGINTGGYIGGDIGFTKDINPQQKLDIKTSIKRTFGPLPTRNPGAKVGYTYKNTSVNANYENYTRKGGNLHNTGIQLGQRIDIKSGKAYIDIKAGANIINSNNQNVSFINRGTNAGVNITF